MTCLFDSVHAKEPERRLRDDEDERGDDSGNDVEQTEWNAPRTVVGDCTGAIADRVDKTAAD